MLHLFYVFIGKPPFTSSVTNTPNISVTHHDGIDAQSPGKIGVFLVKIFFLANCLRSLALFETFSLLAAVLFFQLFLTCCIRFLI